MMELVLNLAHDHHDLNRKVRALGAALAKLERDPREDVARDLVVPISDLREHLFVHFGREEEGLFPFVADASPESAYLVRGMATAHDAICGALARMFHLAFAGADLSTVAALFRRFEQSYTAHAATETTLLQTLDRRLGPVQRARLAALVDGL